MRTIQMSLLRGVCQTPAYVAQEKGFFREEGLDVEIAIAPTAWQVPERLECGEAQFAVIPWTRVAASTATDSPLVLLAGSGCEEAAIVVRDGKSLEDVKSVSIPRRGGMKDLTAMGFLEHLGWTETDEIRQPSGDGAIIALFGEGADAASMIEPYATMFEMMGRGKVVLRSGDLWPGVPGCSLTATREFVKSDPDVVESVVRAFHRGAQFVCDHRDETAEIAHHHIGIHPRFISAALRANRPDVDAIRHEEAMDGVLSLMMKLEYVDSIPTGFHELRFLDQIQAESGD
jgi:NitT/TauT family transport system substrate-binding protein